MTQCTRPPGRISAWFLPFAILVLPPLSLAPARPALASEALSDLEVQARLIDTSPSNSSHGAAMTGEARLEVVVQTRVPASDLSVRVLHPDGTPWTAASRPFDAGRPVWSRFGEGAAVELDAGAPSLGAREGARAVLRVPLERAGLHEIVVEVSANSPGGALRGESVVAAPLGVTRPQPVDDGTVVNFRLEVRP
jgi:hypothetical protein